MKPLTIDINQSDEFSEIALIQFVGELDSGSIGKISKSFAQVVDKNYGYAIADMSKVISVSSAALGELMGCRTYFVDRGGDLVLAGLPWSVHERLSAMDADRIFKFYGNIRSAINDYQWNFQGNSEAVSLHFPSELRFVPPVRQLVSRIARQKGYSNRDSFRIETIVDEICNNAVEHGLARNSQNVELNVEIDRQKVDIKVVNKSNPEKIEALKDLTKSLHEPQCDEDQRRGRGLVLVKMLSSDFRIETSEIGTSVHVTKIREEQ